MTNTKTVQSQAGEEMFDAGQNQCINNGTTMSDDISDLGILGCYEVEK